MRLLKRLWLNYASGGYIYQAETVTLLRALTGTYSTARKIQIDKLIKSLKTAGIWSKLDVLQMYAAPTAADAVVNWKSPGTFNATLVNSPTLEADRGITGDGASSYVNSGFNPTTAAGNYAQNSAGVHIAVKTDIGDNSYVAGVTDTVSIIQLRIRTAANGSVSYINDTTGVSLANTSSLGLFSLVRTAANAVYWRRNKISLGTASTNSTAIPTKNIYVGAYNSNGTAASHTTRQIALFAISAGLSTGEADSFADAVETYLDYIGAGVI